MKTYLLGAALLLSTGAAGGGVVTSSEVHQAVEAFVRAETRTGLDPGERVEVLTRWQRDVEVNGSGTPQIRVQRVSARPLSGPTVLKVAFVVGGKVERQASVTADIRRHCHVLVARRGAERGERIAADLVEVAERDVTAQWGGLFTDPAQVEGMRTRRRLQPGDLITRDHLEAVPLVHRGSTVHLMVRTPHLEVSTLGVALEDGGAGEGIRVRNVDSGKVVHGEVVDAQTVRVP